MSRLLDIIANLRRKQATCEDFLLAEQKPRYVAVIMDGNGRWAARRHLPAIAGHREGTKALKRVIRAARRFGINELTIYAFSTENWNRPEQEVTALMGLFLELIEKEVAELHEQEVQVRFIGRRDRLSPELIAKMDWAEELTRNNSAMKIFVAFNYGGRAEITDAIRAAIGNGALGRLQAGDEIDLGKYMYAPEMHDPELLIRTSGEQRTSNFLLWQCAYCELYFSEKLWPDFGEEEMAAAVEEFSRRQRRFGAR